MQDTLTKLVTYDDYREMPDDGNQYQIIGGELYMTAAPFSRHQQTVRNIFRIIDEYTVQNDLGETYFAPFDVVFSMVDVVQPDILFVAKERLAIISEKNIVAAPDLIVEVLSDSTKNIDRNPKKNLYATQGVKEYWIADPEAQTIEQFILKNGKLELNAKADRNNPEFKCVLMKGMTVNLTKVYNLT